MYLNISSCEIYKYEFFPTAISTIERHSLWQLADGLMWDVDEDKTRVDGGTRTTVWNCPFLRSILLRVITKGGHVGLELKHGLDQNSLDFASTDPDDPSEKEGLFLCVHLTQKEDVKSH